MVLNNFDTNNSHTVKWFQVFLSNINNSIKHLLAHHYGIKYSYPILKIFKQIQFDP